VRLLDLFQSADRAPDQDADLITVRLGDRQPRFLQCFLRRHHGELDEARHMPSRLAIEPGVGLEIDDLAGDLAGRAGRIERLDPPNPRTTSLDRLPRFAGAMAERGNRAGPGDDNARPVYH